MDLDYIFAIEVHGITLLFDHLTSRLMSFQWMSLIAPACCLWELGINTVIMSHWVDLGGISPPCEGSIRIGYYGVNPGLRHSTSVPRDSPRIPAVVSLDSTRERGRDKFLLSHCLMMFKKLRITL